MAAETLFAQTVAMRCRAATASILCAQQVVAVASSMRYIMDTELVTAVYQKT